MIEDGIAANRANNQGIITDVRNNRDNIEILKLRKEITLLQQNRTRDDSDKDNEGEENNEGIKEDNDQPRRLQRVKQKLEEFCESWSLDCRAIAIAAMMTSGLVAVGIIIVIATIAQTIKLTIRSNRARKYLDLKST